MRRQIVPLALAVALSPLALPAVAAHATDAHDVSVSWPSGPYARGQQVAVTVTARVSDDPLHVSLLPADGQGPALATTVLPPDHAPTEITLDLPTDLPGDQELAVVADLDGAAGTGDEIVAQQVAYAVLRDATTVTARFPSGTYRARSRVGVTGRLSGTPGRRVDLQGMGLNGTWFTLARSRTRSDGSYRLAAPTWWVAEHTLRVVAPVTELEVAATAPETGQLTVRRTYRPRRGRDFSYLTGSRNRWDPCTTVDYRINRDRMPRWGGRLWHWGMRRMAEATGLRFRYAGGTNFVPYRGRTSGSFPDNADMVLAWAGPKLVPGLRGSTVGLGGAWLSGGELFDGQVVLDGTQWMGSTRRAVRRNTKILILHELGHAIGLGHVADRRQIMASGSYIRPTFARGDLRGLASIGAQQGCLTSSVRQRTGPPQLLVSRN